MQEKPTVANVTQNLLLGQCPLTAGVVNAIFVFATFLLSLPALFLPTNRGWLRAQGWLVVVCATFTLGLGVAIWVETLQTRQNLSVLWGRESPQIQSLLQQKVRDARSGRRDAVLTWSSLAAVDTSTPLRLHSSRTRHAPMLSLQLKRVDALVPSHHSPIDTSIRSSLQPLALSVLTSSWFSAWQWS